MYVIHHTTKAELFNSSTEMIMDLAKQRIYKIKAMTVQVRKYFDRTNKKQRECQDFYKDSERRLSCHGIPIMALIATISDNEQGVSCTEQLHGLVLIKSSVVEKEHYKKKWKASHYIQR